MRKKIIVANFKSNKTRSEMEQWMNEFDMMYEKKTFEDKMVILAPSMPSLSFVSNRLLSYTPSFALAVQDLSQFPTGSYTGAVSPENLEGFHVKYAIIGHSERRLLMGETEDEIRKKCKQALTHDIAPILCVQGVDTPVHDGVTIVAYEPVEAIGTGNPDSPENANNVAKLIKEKNENILVLYGGSVKSDNVQTFISQSSIDGVLVGKASLDPKEFIKIIEHA